MHDFGVNAKVRMSQKETQHDGSRQRPPGAQNRLYALFAGIGKALSSPHRLELLELLAQGERTAESLADEIGLSLANASQHLQTLRQASLVETRKQGLHVYYRLAECDTPSC